MRDTVNAWWSDTSAVYAHLSQVRDSANAWWSDSSAVYAHLSQVRDSATIVWNDSATLMLRADGAVSLTGDWSTDDFDVKGIEHLEADTITGTVVLITDTIDVRAIHIADSL